MKDSNLSVSVYQMAISNTARAIRSQPPAIRDNDPIPELNAFTASSILAVAFCKAKEEVIADLLRAEV